MASSLVLKQGFQAGTSSVDVADFLNSVMVPEWTAWMNLFFDFYYRWISKDVRKSKGACGNGATWMVCFLPIFISNVLFFFPQKKTPHAATVSIAESRSVSLGKWREISVTVVHHLLLGIQDRENDDQNHQHYQISKSVRGRHIWRQRQTAAGEEIFYKISGNF